MIGDGGEIEINGKKGGYLQYYWNKILSAFTLWLNLTIV